MNFYVWHRLLEKLIASHSEDEDFARREYVLNVILFSVFTLFVLAFAHNFIESLIGHNNPLPDLLLLGPAVFLFLLLRLSHGGYARIVSSLLIFSTLGFAAYLGYEWGVDLPAGILLYVLSITMAGILISSHMAFTVTGMVAYLIFLIGTLQSRGIVAVDDYWASERWNTGEMFFASVLLIIVSTVSWLSNREIEKSLARARRSEAQLKKERNLLEMKVEERTRELKETQATQVAQMHRFAEFGRLSAGLFHDLMNPLTALSLGMERIKTGNRELRAEADRIGRKIGTGPVDTSVTLVENVVRSVRRLENMVASVQKQLKREESATWFSVPDEVRDILEALEHRAQKEHTTLKFNADISDGQLFGDAVKFGQMVLNLVSNAIDARADILAPCVVEVVLRKEKDRFVLSVEDKGVGIPYDSYEKVFEPFYTTKEAGDGIGIGLSMVKHIVEQDFGGTLAFESTVGKGSVFTATFPLVKGTLEK